MGHLDKIEKVFHESKNKGIKLPNSIDVLQLGRARALFDLAERLEIRQIINDYVGKREQGLPVGDSILLAAINRALKPVNKNAFFENWFSGTVLPNLFPLANKKKTFQPGILEQYVPNKKRCD